MGLHCELDYVVYLETTTEALYKMVKEHETAKEFHMIEEESELEEFLPEEIN